MEIQDTIGDSCSHQSEHSVRLALKAREYGFGGHRENGRGASAHGANERVSVRCSSHSTSQTPCHKFRSSYSGSNLHQALSMSCSQHERCKERSMRNHHRCHSTGGRSPGRMPHTARQRGGTVPCCHTFNSFSTCIAEHEGGVSIMGVPSPECTHGMLTACCGGARALGRAMWRARG